MARLTYEEASYRFVLAVLELIEALGVGKVVRWLNAMLGAIAKEAGDGSES